jgi:tRNA-(ms[2]io[6]A)-hydroxylase
MLKPAANLLGSLIQFLRVPTPYAWLQASLRNLATLLVDHAHCERKAAATAINFISKYPEKKS